MVQFVLKTSYQGDIRRLTFDSVEQVSFEFIRTFVAKSYDVQDFLAKYQDEEGDWCTLTAATLSDAMDLVKDKQLLRLEIQSAGSRSPSALPPVRKAAETSPRSPSVCSWEMLDFDAEDEDMEIEEESVVATEVTQNTGEVSRVAPLDELPPDFPKGLESLESSESGADSEDSFLVAEAPASVDETSAGDDECFVLEPIDQANAQEDPAEPVEPAEPIDVDQEMPDVQPSAPPLAAAAPEPGPATEDAEELSSEEKINLILAAFDKNGDGRLNFEETIDLLMWAYAELIPFEVRSLAEARVNQMVKASVAFYHKNVIDHYENPRNVGSMDKDDINVGTGLVGAPACGDVMKLQIKVDENGKIVDAKFKTFGCGSAIASSSLATEWVKGKSVEDAKKVKNQEIAKELSLPPVKLHCSMLAEDAIKAALSDYKVKQESLHKKE